MSYKIKPLVWEVRGCCHYAANYAGLYYSIYTGTPPTTVYVGDRQLAREWVGHLSLAEAKEYIEKLHNDRVLAFLEVS